MSHLISWIPSRGPPVPREQREGGRLGRGLGKVMEYALVCLKTEGTNKKRTPEKPVLMDSLKLSNNSKWVKEGIIYIM